MAKKDNTPKLNPAICLRSLTKYQERISALMGILPLTLDLLKQSDAAGKRVGEILTEHYQALQEFHNNIPE